MIGIKVKVSKSGAKRFVGIEAEAKRLRVSYGHLRYVLLGERKSERIMRDVRIMEGTL